MVMREIVKIDEDKCDGCGLCVPNCHEGALQIIDDKARLISDLFCDGLGACLGHCPQGAITIEKREAEAYDEKKVMEIMVEKGKNTIGAHLNHLKDHGEDEFYKEAIEYLKEIDYDIDKLDLKSDEGNKMEEKQTCGCPGSAMRDFSDDKNEKNDSKGHSGDNEDEVMSGFMSSTLKQWPVQMHLVPPTAPFFRGKDVVLTADCVAYALGEYHQKYLKGKGIAIACPKLDSGLDSYEAKLISMIDDAKINSLTVMIMEVPCCGGLIHLATEAASKANRKVPIKLIVVGIKGDIIKEEWV